MKISKKHIKSFVICLLLIEVIMFSKTTYVYIKHKACENSINGRLINQIDITTGFSEKIANEK